MGAETETQQVHGGRLVAQRLKAHGVTKLFTLSGGHLFSIYDGCREEGIDIVDVRHEQAAAFAAEGWAKVTREPGVAALTAGPGVTNGMSAMASALMNNSPMVVLGGRAPALRWGQGSLQEIDHVPFVRPVTKFAATPESTAEIPALVDEAFACAVAPHSGPAFVDFPLDYVFMEAEPPEAAPERAAEPAVDQDQLDRAVELLREAERPVIMAGTNAYWARAEDQLRALAEELRIPVFLNGLARGMVPADHELFFSRARGNGLKGADVALVVGVPMDFRLGFGGSFGEETELIVLDRAEPIRDHPRPVAAELYGDVAGALEALRGASAGSEEWVAELRAAEDEKRAAEQAELSDDRSPLHPMRLYKELGEVIDRDAIVIGDGGDFVSYAGRVVDSYEPGCWLDPGPYGCLGSGPGYALAAKLARPDKQVVLLLGDGAFGFSGLEFDIFMAGPGRWMEWMSQYGGTATAGPNFSYVLATRALNRADQLDLSRLRIALNGAEPVDPSTVAGFIEAGARHGLRPGAVFPAFGMAEVAIAGTFPEPMSGLRTDAVDRRVLEVERYAAPVDGDAHGARHLAILGRPVQGLEVRVVDPVTGDELTEREVGELEIRGTSVTPGYYKRPEANAELFHDGWLRTGDLAYLLDGEMVMCGRIKDMIIVGGRNVFPEDIERALAEVEGVRAGNVIAFGVDNQGKEGVVVVAEAKHDDHSELRRSVGERVRAAIGLPAKDIVLVEPGSLPKTSSGKLQRSLCKLRYIGQELQTV